MYPLSSSLETIGDEVFRNTNLAEINIPSTVTTIGDEAFRNTNLAEINIPKAVTTIKGGAFYQTTHLTTVTFEQGSLLSSIGGDAFAYSGITSFKLINDVDIVDKAVFYGASNLATIEIEENSELYLMENGVLFTKDKKTLIIYLNSKTDETYEIPNSVVTIDPLAFYGHTHLKEVNFGSTPSLTTIKGNAFKESSLQKISLPTTVTRIDPGVFHSTFLEYIIVPSGVTTMGAEPFNVEGISVYVDLPSAGSWWHPIWDEGATVYYKPNWTTDGNGVPYVITVNVTKDPEITCVNEDLEGQQLTAGTQVEFEIAATGQEIKELTLNIDGVVSSPTVLNNKFTITIPTVDFSLNVTLEYIPYTLTYSINDGQFIITQNVHYGQK